MISPPLLRENVKSDKDELREKLRSLFLEKAKALMEGEAVKKCEKKLEVVLSLISGINKRLANGLQIGVANAVLDKREGLKKEKELISKRLEEFRNGMRCVIDHLEAKHDVFGDEIRVLKFGREFNWVRFTSYN